MKPSDRKEIEKACDIIEKLKKTSDKRQATIANMNPVIADQIVRQQEEIDRQAEEIKKLKILKEFARKIIGDYCWNLADPDGGDIQDIAEKLGLIAPKIATEEDVHEESDFEIGDMIYKFTDILISK